MCRMKRASLIFSSLLWQRTLGSFNKFGSDNFEATLAKCEAVSIDINSCLGNTSMKVFSDIMNTYDHDTCTPPPMISKDVISRVVDESRTQCDLDTDDPKVGHITLEYETLFFDSVDDCWCGNENHSRHDNFEETLAKCEEVEIDPASCIGSTSMKIFSEITNGYDNQRCIPPPHIDKETIRRVMDESRVMCNLEITDAEIHHASFQYEKLFFDAVDCWCGQENNPSGANMIDFLLSCADVKIDPESCIAQQTLLTFQEAPFALHLQQLENATSSCGQPFYLDEYFIESLVNASRFECEEQGIQTEQEELDFLIGELTNVIHANECWELLCDQINQPIINDGIENSEEIVGFLMSCVDLEIENESCMIENAMGMIERELQLYQPELFGIETNACPPQFLTDGYFIGSIVNASYIACEQSGVPVNQTDIDDLTDTLEIIVNSDICWNYVCDQISLPDIDGGQVEDVFDYLSSCADIRVDQESCLVGQTIVFVEQGYIMHSLKQLGQEGSICDHQSLMNDNFVQSLVHESRVACEERGIPVNETEVIDWTEDLNNMLGARDCWESFCTEHLEPEITQGIDMITDLIFGYVAGCADVLIDQESCLVGTAIQMTFSEVIDNFQVRRQLMQTGDSEDGHIYGDNSTDDTICSSPTVDPKIIEAIIDGARHQCEENGIEVSEQEVFDLFVSIETIAKADDCWESLCTTDANDGIVSSFLETCAAVELPFPLPSEEEMDYNPTFFEPGVKLTCMVDYAMTVPPHVFDMENTISQSSFDDCYPTGHFDMENFCPELLGPAAIEHCSSITLLPDLPDIPDIPDIPDYDFGDSSFSYDYFEFEFSMSYGYGGGGGGPGSNSQYIKNLCDIMIQLSSKQGKQCLGQLCALRDGIISNFPGEEMLSEEPSLEPSSQPSGAPSVSLTHMPSVKPTLPPAIVSSSAPSFQKTMSPTDKSSKSPISKLTQVPASKPTQVPTSKPTQVPTSKLTQAPTSKPTQVPTKAPTTIVVTDPDSSNPTQLPTSAPIASIPQKSQSVQITFDAGIKMKLNQTDIPTSGIDFVKYASVLEQAIEKNLPLGASAKIISIDGRQVRRLQTDEDDEVEIIFEVKMEVPCDDGECTEEEAAETTEQFYAEAIDQLETSVTEGTLEATIKVEAEAAGVEALADVIIDSDSFTAAAAESVVIEKDNGEGTPVSGSYTVMHHSPLLWVLFASMMW